MHKLIVLSADFRTDLFTTQNITATGYARRLFKSLVDGLAAEHVRTFQIAFSNFQWLLPKPDSTIEELGFFDDVHSMALTVPDSKLQQIMKMEISHASSPGTPAGYHFYIRSWEMTGDQLQRLLNAITLSGNTFPESILWQNTLSICQRKAHLAPTHYTIRYVGTCEGPKRPADRYQEDLRRLQRRSVGEFMEYLQQSCPGVANATKVYLLPDASLPLGASDTDRDDTERMLIQFFHHPTLLNRQRGGLHNAYSPSYDDAQGFRDLKTDFFAHFDYGATQIHPIMATQLFSHFADIQQYVNENRGASGTGVKYFSDELRHTILCEATPMSFRGVNILVFIGKDTTVDDYVNATWFIDGGSRAGRIVRDALHRVTRYEAEAHNRDFSARNFDPHRGAWCFIDMWPWLKKNDAVQARKYLRDYMQITQPLVSISYGVQTTSVVRANFLHDRGLKYYRNFTRAVGEATIQYTAVDADGEPDESTAFINIPHLHPGLDRYGPERVEVNRLMDLTMQYTILMGQAALDIVDGMHQQMDLVLSREKICQHILKAVKKVCKEHKAYARLLDNLTQARTDVIALGGPRSKNERAGTSNTNESLVEQLEPPLGKPYSAKRLQQLDKLWAKNVPVLHRLLPHEDCRKADWVQALWGVPEDGCYLTWARENESYI